MQYGDPVVYNDGTDPDVYAEATKVNADDTLNLVTFPTTSPVEHVQNVPEGTGGRTWRKHA